MTWIKICGTTNLEDAMMSVEAGADALGFVFWEKSPRNVDPQAVRKIVEKLPAQIEKVGVFVREPFERVRQIVEDAGLTAAQLHFTNLAEEGWATAGFRKFVVFHVADAPAGSLRLGTKKRSEPPKWIDPIFLDSGTPEQPGGTGKTFGWKKWAHLAKLFGRRQCLVVAGGLTPENVGEAIRILEPWGVDVVSGVEARPGKKDSAKVHAFIQAVREAQK